MSDRARELAELIATNRSALPHRDHFASHRARLSALIAAASPPGAEGRLCILGAGNCHDIDLPQLTAAYREVHLVDLDRAAVEAALAREPPEVRERIKLHAPLDLSGMLDRLEAWRAMRTTPDELMAFPDAAARQVTSQLPAPFDVVASTCLLTQLQLAALRALTERHPLFEAARQLVNLQHLRALARLLGPGGKALLVNDVASNATYPLDRAQGDLVALMSELVRAGNVIYAVNPELVAWTLGEDPYLKRYIEAAPIRDVWLWQNGPERLFLVYALLLTRRA
jgi:hypothetical protein